MLVDMHLYVCTHFSVTSTRALRNVQELLDILDINRSGDVDMDEFVAFWNNAPPLRFGDDDQVHCLARAAENSSLYDDAARELVRVLQRLNQ